MTAVGGLKSNWLGKFFLIGIAYLLGGLSCGVVIYAIDAPTRRSTRCIVEVPGVIIVHHEATQRWPTESELSKGLAEYCGDVKVYIFVSNSDSYVARIVADEIDLNRIGGVHISTIRQGYQSYSGSFF